MPSRENLRRSNASPRKWQWVPFRKTLARNGLLGLKIGDGYSEVIWGTTVVGNH